MIIKSLKAENQRLINQRTLTELSRGPIMNFNFKNETKPCYQPDYSLLVVNRIARNGNNEETIVTKANSSVRVPPSSPHAHIRAPQRLFKNIFNGESLISDESTGTELQAW